MRARRQMRKRGEKVETEQKEMVENERRNYGDGYIKKIQ